MRGSSSASPRPAAETEATLNSTAAVAVGVGKDRGMGAEPSTCTSAFGSWVLDLAVGTVGAVSSAAGPGIAPDASSKREYECPADAAFEEGSDGSSDPDPSS